MFDYNSNNAKPNKSPDLSNTWIIDYIISYDGKLFVFYLIFYIVCSISNIVYLITISVEPDANEPLHDIDVHISLHQPSTSSQSKTES